MFTNRLNRDSSKLDVLESKLSIYESLSREMVDKLESAVDKISEGNSRITAILAKHAEKIEQSSRTDELIIRMIEETKKQNTVEHDRVIKRIETIEVSISELSKFKWQALALVGSCVIVIGWVVTFVDKTGISPYSGSDQIHNTRTRK
jgi:hypothetical protein